MIPTHSKVPEYVIERRYFHDKVLQRRITSKRFGESRLHSRHVAAPGILRSFTKWTASKHSRYNLLFELCSSPDAKVLQRGSTLSYHEVPWAVHLLPIETIRLTTEAIDRWVQINA